MGALLVDGSLHFGKFGLCFLILGEHVLDDEDKVVRSGSHGAVGVVAHRHVAGVADTAGSFIARPGTAGVVDQLRDVDLHRAHVDAALAHGAHPHPGGGGTSSSIPRAHMRRNLRGSMSASPVAGQPETQAPQVRQRLRLPPSGRISLRERGGTEGEAAPGVTLRVGASSFAMFALLPGSLRSIMARQRIDCRHKAPTCTTTAALNLQIGR
jgi:hypothetical protein